MSDRVISVSTGGLSHPFCITVCLNPLRRLQRHAQPKGGPLSWGRVQGSLQFGMCKAGGDLLISFCQSETLTVSLTRASCRGLEKNLSITDPIRQTVKVKVLVAQSCPTLCESMDCSLPGSSFPGIFQARKLEWVPCLSPFS